MVDLEICFYSNLTFKDHISEKINEMSWARKVPVPYKLVAFFPYIVSWMIWIH